MCRFKIRITPKELAPDNPDRPRLSKEPPGGGVSLPKIQEIMRPQWPQNKFTEHSSCKCHVVQVSVLTIDTNSIRCFFTQKV